MPLKLASRSMPRTPEPLCVASRSERVKSEIIKNGVI